MGVQIPLVIAAVVFLAFIVLRLVPMSSADGSAAQARADLKAARKRLDEAKSDEERVAALVAAGNASAKLVSGGGRAVQYYLRAMKLAPDSAELVDRVAAGMARRPRGLENILWRRLGAKPEEWGAEAGPVLASILKHLADLYAGPLKSSVRARAFANMMSAIAAKTKAQGPSAAQSQ